MSDVAAGTTVYVILVSRVREAIQALLARDTHPFFIAYLYLRRLAGRQRRLTDLTPNWPALGTYLEVAGGPPSKPFLRPFWRGARGAGQEWLNENLAGSFAPSSLRGVPQRVIETGAAGRFNLRPEHWQLARQHLLYDQPLPAAAVAAFLFRDYGIRATSAPGADDIVALFRREFGYRAEDDAEFAHLFDGTWSGVPGPWTEPLVEPGGP